MKSFTQIFQYEQLVQITQFTYRMTLNYKNEHKQHDLIVNLQISSHETIFLYDQQKFCFCSFLVNTVPLVLKYFESDSSNDNVVDNVKYENSST